MTKLKNFSERSRYKEKGKKKARQFDGLSTILTYAVKIVIQLEL